MSEETYFIISNSDGDTTVEELTKDMLNKRLEEYIEDLDPECIPTHMSEIIDSDTNYWNDNILIIKGTIVVPKEVDIVTKMVME